VRIGTVSVAVKDPENPEMVPHKVDPLYDGSQEILRHLRWLMQKDQLQQDIFLIGYSPPARHLSLAAESASPQSELPPFESRDLCLGEIRPHIPEGFPEYLPITTFKY